MKYQIKFEWLYIVLITAVLTAVFFYTQDPEQRNMVLTALIGMLTTVGGFLFGRSTPEK